ncbi:hypothetical protein CSC78_06080 [Pseudoxanthomonas japonensis]|uniref:Uncharacterized protein n=1 Tax=Pseudoxanthomonas japonensis TaxID=69284 RepID=A0ABQ6ZJH9_9GAMM|nr:hypothetical protein CSC78_06080 [Pseudoxanthomonas japonensis]
MPLQGFVKGVLWMAWVAERGRCCGNGSGFPAQREGVIPEAREPGNPLVIPYIAVMSNDEAIGNLLLPIVRMTKGDKPLAIAGIDQAKIPSAKIEAGAFQLRRVQPQPGHVQFDCRRSDPVCRVLANLFDQIGAVIVAVVGLALRSECPGGLVEMALRHRLDIDGAGLGQARVGHVHVPVEDDAAGELGETLLIKLGAIGCGSCPLQHRFPGDYSATGVLDAAGQGIPSLDFGDSLITAGGTLIQGKMRCHVGASAGAGGTYLLRYLGGNEVQGLP